MEPTEFAQRLRTHGETVFTGLGATVFLLDGLRFAVESTYPGDCDHAFGPARVLSLPWHLGEDHFLAIQALRKIA